MEDLEKAKSVFEEGRKIRSYFDEYGTTLEEYKSINPRTDVDKYHNEFNYDDRFAACKSHKVFFSSARGRYGSSSCCYILKIDNPDVFWKAFDEYINLHRRDIFKYIASYYEGQAKKMKDAIIEERDNLNKLLEELK